MPTLTRAVRTLKAPARTYFLYTQYYAGNHRLAFSTEKFRNAFGFLFRAYALNMCPSVVNAVADRLQVIGFQLEKAGKQASNVSAPDALADEAWNQIWLPNKMHRKSGEVHQQAIKNGDAYVIVWPDETGFPVISPQRAELCHVQYDIENPAKVAWACKGWLDQDMQRARLNLYYADRIEKYVTRTKVQQDGSGGSMFPERVNSWVEWEEDDATWPLENPYGVVPVFHFANDADVGMLGKSELKDVIPLQDQLNKAVIDMMVAMEFQALPQRWATGLEMEDDPVTGKPKVPFQPGADRIWAVGDKDVTFGQFAAADLGQFIKAQDSVKMDIARVSGTPLHFFMLNGGNPPSGEALEALEARLIKKVRDRQNTFGDVWQDVINLAFLIMGRSNVQLSTEWEDPAPKSMKELADTTLVKKQIGVSERQCLIELGYSDQQIEEMQSDKQDQQTNLGAALLANFDRGNPADTGNTTES